MENLQKNFPFEDQITLLDHAQQSISHEEILSKYFSNMNNTIDPSNHNDNKESHSITGNSGLQSSHHHPNIAELENSTIIHIPFYFENNNVYSRDAFLNHPNFYDQGLQNNNNMLLHCNSGIPFEQPQNTEWPVTLSSQVPVNEMYHHMVLESPFPSPISTSPFPLITFEDSQNFPFSSRRPQGFSPLYETECQSRVSTNLHSANTICSQKPPVYTKWTEEEDELLRAAISIYGPHKWSLIAAHVPNRTPMQCSTRWLGALNPTIHKGRWTPEEDAALKESVNEYVDLLDSDGHPQPIPWNKIASRIPHRTGIQCQARWSEALDPSVRKGKWSPEEDEILKEGVRRYGRCWIRIAELIDGRTQRQCRTRWVQIKNKQAKIERDAIAAKSATETTISTDDEGNEILTPPRTTPSTPSNHARGIQGQGMLRSMNHMDAGPSAVPQATITKNQSPIMSSETRVTEGSCIVSPENLSSSPSFDKSRVYLFNYHLP